MPPFSPRTLATKGSSLRRTSPSPTTAAAQVRLGDERAEPPAELMTQRFQFALVRRGIERPAAQADVGAFGHREADEVDARVAVVVRLAAGDGPRQALLAVEAVAGGED